MRGHGLLKALSGLLIHDAKSNDPPCPRAQLEMAACEDWAKSLSLMLAR